MNDTYEDEDEINSSLYYIRLTIFWLTQNTSREV